MDVVSCRESGEFTFVVVHSFAIALEGFLSVVIAKHFQSGVYTHDYVVKLEKL